MITVGIDEAGVGTWAGPMIVVGAAFREDTKFPELVRDSKKLSCDQREGLVDDIYDLAEWVIIKRLTVDYLNAVEEVWPQWDKVVREIVAQSREWEADEIIVDGLRMVDGLGGVIYEPKADDTYPEVSAASVVAKYVQTCAMEDLHRDYPGYGFNKHHGYGTKEHKDRLEELGPTRGHRIFYKPIKVVVDNLPVEDRHELRRLALKKIQIYTSIIDHRR